MKKIFGALLALVSSVAFGATLNPIQLLNPTGSSAGQAIVSTGASSAPAWSNVTASGLVAQAANTVVANATASSASPTAIAMPSCSTSASALTWTTSTGFTCNTSINAATLGGATFAAPGPIGSTTASTGAFTTLSASSTVSGAGFSTYLASPPAIGGTTAASGKFTTLQATGAITPSTTAGIVGTTAADNANAGSVGEYPTSPIVGSSTTLTTATYANLTGASVTLTAGDWDVEGVCVFVTSAGAVALTCGINNVSGTAPGSGFQVTSLSTTGTFGSSSFSTPVWRLNVSTSTTVYVGGQCNFSSGTCSGTGYLRYTRRR